MARTDLTISSLGSRFVDLRDAIPGDSFNWSWVRPLSQVKYLAIHHTASPDTQTPAEIANYHINSNKWGGIGYHFLIARDGTVFYVGDIATARANVANLNEQVLGICLIGNFTGGHEPTDEQLGSAHDLCDFFINHYPDIVNITGWDVVRGHKELPGQATACPGDTWDNWRPRLVSGVGGGVPVVSQPVPTPLVDQNAWANALADLYRVVLGREPDQGGLQTYLASGLSLEQVRLAMTESSEHQHLLQLAGSAQDLQSQVTTMQNTITVQNTQIGQLQMTVSSLNSQVAALRGSLQQRQAELDLLRQSGAPSTGGTPAAVQPQHAPDKSVTLASGLISLFNLVFGPRKVQ